MQEDYFEGEREECQESYTPSEREVLEHGSKPVQISIPSSNSSLDELKYQGLHPGVRIHPTSHGDGDKRDSELIVEEVHKMERAEH